MCKSRYPQSMILIPAGVLQKAPGDEKALPHKDINRIPFMSKARGHQKIW